MHLMIQSSTYCPSFRLAQCKHGCYLVTFSSSSAQDAHTAYFRSPPLLLLFNCFSELRGSAKVAPPLPPRSQVNVASAEAAAAAAAAAAAVKPAPVAAAASAPAAQPAAAAKVPDAAAKAAPMASAAPAAEGKQQDDNQAKPAADNFSGFELHEHLGIAALQIVGFVIACAIFAACYLALAILKSPVLLSRAIGLC
jgi:hypothetical protein